MNKSENNKDVIINAPTATAYVTAYPPTIITYEIHWKKDWLKLGIVALSTIASQWLTAFIIVGWIGMTMGIVLAIGIFFLGIYGVTRTINKTVTS